MIAITTSSSMRVNAHGRMEGGRMGRILSVSCLVRTLNVWNRLMVKELNGFLVCNVERSETSLAVTFTLPKDEIQRFFASLRMTMRVMAQRFDPPLVHLSTDHAHLAICSGNGHCAQSELSCMQKSS